ATARRADCTSPAPCSRGPTSSSWTKALPPWTRTPSNGPWPWCWRRRRRSWSSLTHEFRSGFKTLGCLCERLPTFTRLPTIPQALGTDQTGSQLIHPLVVRLGLLVTPDQAPVVLEPAMRPLHHEPRPRQPAAVG